MSVCFADVAHTYTEPLILRVNGTPKRLLEDDYDGVNCNHKASLSHSVLPTPKGSVTCE